MYIIKIYNFREELLWKKKHLHVSYTNLETTFSALFKYNYIWT